MDSQENTLQQGNLESKEQVDNANNATSQQSQPVNATTETKATDSEKTGENESSNNQMTEQPMRIYQTKAEILDRLKEIVANDEYPQKKELDHLKTIFYKLHIAECDAQQKEYINNGGNPATYQVLPDDQEEAFKAEMGVIKEKKS